jgi:hypothetical protein
MVRNRALRAPEKRKIGDPILPAHSLVGEPSRDSQAS